MLISRKLEIPCSVFTLAPGSYNMKLLWINKNQTTLSSTAWACKAQSSVIRKQCPNYTLKFDSYWNELRQVFPGRTGSNTSCWFRWVGKIPWRRKWQPTLAFLSDKSHGQRSPAGYNRNGHQELDTTEWLDTQNELVLRFPFIKLCIWGIWHLFSLLDG